MSVVLTTERVILRNWTDDDRDLFHEINSDPQVMEFFPMRRDRAQSDMLLDQVIAGISETGFGFHALAFRPTNEAFGFCGLSRTNLEPCLPDGTVEIGWRLARRHWGKGYATEAAFALLSHGFDGLDLSEIVAFAVAANHRSTAVMARIGMQHDRSRDFDHPRVPDELPHLKRCVLYAIRREAWKKRAQNRNVSL